MIVFVKRVILENIVTNVIPQKVIDVWIQQVNAIWTVKKQKHAQTKIFVMERHQLYTIMVERIVNIAKWDIGGHIAKIMTPRVMPVMRADDKGRKHGNDEGRGGADGSYSDASGIDAAGRNGHSSSYGRPAIVIGAAGKGRAEQGGTKQKGETLHGGLLAER